MRYNPLGNALQRRRDAGVCLICGADLRKSPLLKNVRLDKGKAGECPNLEDGRHGKPGPLTFKKLRKMQKNAKRQGAVAKKK